MTCLREGTVALPDGRRLGYGEYGVRGGKPVLLFHGSPGGRQFDQGRAVVDAGAWLFVVERPGYGLSDPKPGRTLLEWPVDVSAFADHFGFERFAVVGFSAGGPYALACGYAIPERVAVLGLAAGVVLFPGESDMDHLAPEDTRERLQRFQSDRDTLLGEIRAENERAAAEWAADPDAFFRKTFGPIAESMAPFWISMMSSTFGVSPDIDDEILMHQPWGFPLEEITVPVHGWYGEPDPLLEGAQELVRRIPITHLTTYPGEGHFLSPAHRPDWHSVLTAWK